MPVWEEEECEAEEEEQRKCCCWRREEEVDVGLRWCFLVLGKRKEVEEEGIQPCFERKERSRSRRRVGSLAPSREEGEEVGRVEVLRSERRRWRRLRKVEEEEDPEEGTRRNGCRRELSFEEGEVGLRKEEECDQ